MQFINHFTLTYAEKLLQQKEALFNCQGPSTSLHNFFEVLQSILKQIGPTRSKIRQITVFFLTCLLPKILSS